MYRMQKEAKRIKKELANIHVEAEFPSGKIVVTAEPEVVSITIHGQSQPELVDALNRGLKKAQIVSAEKMKPLMGDMGLTPGEQ